MSLFVGLRSGFKATILLQWERSMAKERKKKDLWHRFFRAEPFVFAPTLTLEVCSGTTPCWEVPFWIHVPTLG